MYHVTTPSPVPVAASSRMVCRSPSTVALAAVATRSWRLSGRRGVKRAAATASRMRPTVRIKLVGEKNPFEARSNHWSTFWPGSGAAFARETAVDVWPGAGGSPRTVLPEGVIWKTLRHFLQTRRVWIFSLEARPSAPQAGHLIASTGIALLGITQGSSQNRAILLYGASVNRNLARSYVRCPDLPSLPAWSHRAQDWENAIKDQSPIAFRLASDDITIVYHDWDANSRAEKALALDRCPCRRRAPAKCGAVHQQSGYRLDALDPPAAALSRGRHGRAGGAAGGRAAGSGSSPSAATLTGFTDLSKKSSRVFWPAVSCPSGAIDSAWAFPSSPRATLPRSTLPTG